MNFRALAGMAVEALGGPATRRMSRHGSRRWIEVRGLSGPDADAVADAVLTAVRAVPGVTDAVVNRSVARVILTVDSRVCTADLPEVVADAERRVGATARHRPLNLPGDDTAVIARAAAAAVAATSLGVSLAASALRIPGLPNLVSVVPTLAAQIPLARNQIVRRLGAEGAELLFAVANAVGSALTVSPSSAAAETVSRTLLVNEAWNARQAWRRHEPNLAEHCHTDGRPRHGRDVLAAGLGEEYASQAGWIGLTAATLIAAVSGSPVAGGAAALVAAPKPTGTSREAFACMMTRGLTTRHDAVIVRPQALRALDRVSAIVIDPRVLYTDELTITRIRGVRNGQRAVVWSAAREALAAGNLGPGWQRLPSVPGVGEAAEVLVSPARDPFATAVVSEARRSGSRVISVADDGLRSLRKGFDSLFPVRGSLDDTLAGVTSKLRSEGATVALIGCSTMAGHHDADITIGMIRDRVPPWGADIFVPDLPSIWRILAAIPAARSACGRGIRLSLSGSAIGSLMLIPGVAGYGPDVVNAAALAGSWSGYTGARTVFRTPLPAPEPVHEWYALSVEDVRHLLPRPSTTSSAPRRSPPAPVRLLGQTASGAWSLGNDFVAAMRSNLADPLTPILTTGAVASAVLGSPLDAALVGVVLLANTSLSSVQQLHADRLLSRLLAIQDPPARRRIGPLEDDAAEDVPAMALRPGDIVEIRTGEVVPADVRLITAGNLEVDESTLTGESLPAVKQTDATPGVPLAERACMVYAGTTVVAGTAVGVVTAVGRLTEVRRAMTLEPSKVRRVGLQSQLSRITNRALPWSLGGGAAVGVLSALRGTALHEAVGSAVGLSVAAVPEGLPLVATLAELAAARKLSGRNVLVRNTNAVEALARLDVVCFDKTGTLSENRLCVTKVRPVRGRSAEQVLAAAARTTDGQTAHATDEAIRQSARDTDAAPGCTYLPFQSGRQFAAVLNGERLTIKGAPEIVLKALRENDSQVAPMMAAMAGKGLRVLAVAERTLTGRQAARAAADPAALERLCLSGLSPIGVLGLADTPRPAATALLDELAARGIGIRLITGDHPVTAAAIATELGMPITPEQVITGSEWAGLSAEERAEAVTCRLVFARMSPENKVEVVQTLERAGLTTAMVGDGANDAAAIRAASVGIGVAAPGSDPARTAADMLLLDGHVEALLDAIDEARQLWRRVQSAVSVLLGGNLGEVAFGLVSTLITGRSVLNARQMLLVNMLTDALPAAALAVSDQDLSAGLDHDEAAMWRAIAVRGGATMTGATLAWLLGRATGRRRRASSIALIGLVCTQLTQTLADSRSPLVVTTVAGSLVTLGAIISTPGVSHLFGCTPLGPLGWGQALAATTVASVASVVAPEVLARLGSLLRDDDADSDEDGVDLADRGSEKPDAGGDEGLGSGQAQEVSHDSQPIPVP